MSNPERIGELIRGLVSALLDMEGLPQNFWGSLTVSVQGGNPSTVEYKHTRKLASPEHREPNPLERDGSHGASVSSHRRG